MSDPTTTPASTMSDTHDPAYENSAETGIVPGADLEEDEAIATDSTSNPLGLTRAEAGVHISTLSDSASGNNSMGTTAIGGFGIGSTNSNSTLP